MIWWYDLKVWWYDKRAVRLKYKADKFFAKRDKAEAKSGQIWEWKQVKTGQAQVVYPDELDTEATLSYWEAELSQQEAPMSQVVPAIEATPALPAKTSETKQVATGSIPKLADFAREHVETNEEATVESAVATWKQMTGQEANRGSMKSAINRARKQRDNT
jgi:hypothetical protein